MSYSTQTRSTSFIMSDDRAKKLIADMFQNMTPKKKKEDDPTNASKEDLPKEGTAEGTQPMDVQEPRGSSAVDVDSGGEVTVKTVDHMLQAEEDRERYSAFVEEDYSMSGELLTCRICEKNIYSINSDHVKSAEHFQRLRVALSSPTRRQEVKLTKGWQMTSNGFFRCYLCQKEYNIREHCSSEAHTLSKEYKTCPRIQDLKLRAYELWKKLPTTIFDELLTLSLANNRGFSAKASFCVGCDERFDTPIERKRHECESQQHRGWVERLRQSDPFSYSFGILSKTRGERDYQLRYCMLCKTGMTNAVEQDDHVHGANSQHSRRMRLFWTKVIPGLLESGLANAFPSPSKDTANYSLNLLPRRRLYYFENLLHVIVISTDDFSWCSLCDQFVCDRSIKKHCDSVKHAGMYKCFSRTFRNPDKRAWGIIQKENVHYCVLCHIAFSNKVEMSVHSNSIEPHLKRVQMFNKLFEPYIRSVVCSLTCT